MARWIFPVSAQYLLSSLITIDFMRSTKKRGSTTTFKEHNGSISNAIKREYVIPFDSQYFIFTYFTQVIGLQMVEHKNPFDESPNSSIYLFIIKNP